MERKRIAVVGAGYCGLASIASLKAEGLEPVGFDISEKCGGMWYYRKESSPGRASLMPTTVINHSKEMGSLSNFPPRKEFANYMKHTELLQYFTEYAKHNDAEKHIRYNTEVIQVKKANDYEKTGRWSVTTKDLITNEVDTQVYDGVMICIGHVSQPFMPKYPGQDDFKGKIMHTHSLKGVEGFMNQTVVVVGNGCSALDAAVESSRVAKQVYLSTRHGAYIINRVGPNGYPMDYILARRYLACFLDILPINFLSWYVETFYINKVFDHRLFKIQPKYHILSKDPILNDHMGHKLLSGAVIQMGDIHHFTENGIVFDGEEEITKVDTVIMATGYTWNYSFLEEGTIVKEDGRINLYKCIYPVNLPHPTLAILGFFNPYGPGFPIGELQARWASYLMAGKGSLPSEDIMLKEVIQRTEANSKRFIPGEKMTVRVDYVQYMDEIAKELGVKPNLLKYLFTDFPLFMRLIFGPCLSYQYRLEGHGKWEGAREAIMTCNERLHWPLIRKKAVEKGIIQRAIECIGNSIPLNFYLWHH